MASYAGMQYDCLQTRYEGHVGNRNCILGIGHVSYDEPAYDVEGKKGPGTRGPKHLRNHLEHSPFPNRRTPAFLPPPAAAAPTPLQSNVHAPNPHHVNHATTHSLHARRGSFLNMTQEVDAQAFKQAAGGGQLGSGKKLYNVGDNPNIVGSGGRMYHPPAGTTSTLHIARNVNVNLRKPHAKTNVGVYQTTSPAATFFGTTTTTSTSNNSSSFAKRTSFAPHHQQQPQQQQPTGKAELNHKTGNSRGNLRASQEYGKNPITGEGHTAYDERDCDLDGKKGAGTRGADGNGHRNQHRNVITGEGLRAYLSKNHSAVKVEDGNCDSYAYYKDRVIPGKELGGDYRPTTQLQWSQQKYEPHALPKQWNWSN